MQTYPECWLDKCEMSWSELKLGGESAELSWRGSRERRDLQRPDRLF